MFRGGGRFFPDTVYIGITDSQYIDNDNQLTRLDMLVCSY